MKLLVSQYYSSTLKKVMILDMGLWHQNKCSIVWMNATKWAISDVDILMVFVYNCDVVFHEFLLQGAMITKEYHLGILHHLCEGFNLSWFIERQFMEIAP